MKDLDGTDVITLVVLALGGLIIMCGISAATIAQIAGCW